jgi:hypothetical protein
MRWPLVLLPVLAAVLAWVLLAPRQDPETSESPATGPQAAPPAVVAPEPRAAPPVEPAALPPEPEPSDPEWITRLLELPAGEGPLSGGALITAVERGGELRFAGATDADLEALRQVQLPDVDRSVAQPYAAMVGWLKEAGLLVERVGSTLVVRRRTDTDSTER